MKRVDWALLTGLLIATFAVYLRIWGAPPLSWDDGSNIFENPFFTMHVWWWVWKEPYYGLYVPVISSVWAFLFWCGGGEVWPFRALNLFLHLANITLVYVLLAALARRWNLRAPVLVLAAAALFALHPLQVEAVAWISGGRDLLAAFFSLSAVAIYFRWRGWKGQSAAALLFACALLSKPGVVTVPLAVWILEPVVGTESWKASLRRLSSWFVLAGVAAWMTRSAQVEHFTVTTAIWQRPLLVLDTYRMYLQKLFWPSPLSGNYARTPEWVLANHSEIWISVLTVLTVAGLGYWAEQKDRRVRASLLWVALLLPVSGLVPFAFENISGLADHYNYLPLIGAGLALMLALNGLRSNVVRAALVIVLAGAWGALSWARLPVWQSDKNFFTDMAKTAPDSYNTAIGMSVVLCGQDTRYDEGLAWVDKALTAHPNDILALADRAFCLSHAGRLKDVVQMDFYLDKLDTESLAATQPTAYSSLLASLGAANIAQENFKEGFQLLCKAYEVKPSEPLHARNLQAAAALLRQHGLDPRCD